jgi:HK97 family phage portal protein
VILDALFRRAETRAGPLSLASSPSSWLMEALGGVSSAAGQTVTEASALALPTVYACIRILAESVAQLPLVLYRQVGRSRKPATDHPLYRLLHAQPNPEHTSFVFRELLMAHLAGYGNAYVLVNRRRSGQVAELWPLRPSQVTVRRASGVKLFSVTTESGAPLQLTDDDILHIPGLSYDGLVGWSPIRTHREAIGWGLATQQFSSQFFGNGAQVSGILSAPGAIQDPEKIKRDWQGRFGDKEKLGIAVLSNGMKFEPIGVNPDDAQFVQTRALQIADICRIFNVPPTLVQDYGRATWSNAEHADLSFVKHSLMPWLVRIESALNASLLSEMEQESLFFKFKVQGLLRGDNAGRSAFYTGAVTNGWMTRNEVRELEDLDPLDGLDEPLTPVAAAQKDPAPGEAPKKDPPAPPDDEDPDNPDDEGQSRAIARAVAGRVLAAELGELRRLRVASPDHDAWLAAANEFYDRHAEHLQRALLVPAGAAKAFVASRWRDLQDPAAVKSTLERWAQEGPDAVLKAVRDVG